MNLIAAVGFRLLFDTFFDSELEAAENVGSIGLESDCSATSGDLERCCEISNVGRIDSDRVVEDIFDWISSLSSAGRAR